MPKYLDRAQFFHMHMLKCAKCREEWLELKDTLPESRRNKALEEVVDANHYNDRHLV